LHRLIRSKLKLHPDTKQAPLQKIDLHYLLTDFGLQLGYAAFGQPPLPVARKRVARA
jgi:hypothetical protein